MTKYIMIIGLFLLYSMTSMIAFAGKFKVTCYRRSWFITSCKSAKDGEKLRPLDPSLHPCIFICCNAREIYSTETHQCSKTEIHDPLYKVNYSFTKCTHEDGKWSIEAKQTTDNVRYKVSCTRTSP